MSYRSCITRWIVVAVVLTLQLARPAAAQARDSLSLDATIGVSTASGGKTTYSESGGVSGELTLGIRVHPERALALLGAITVGRRAKFEIGSGDVLCVVPPAGTSGANSACAPHFPDLTHVGVLGCLEGREGALSLRALAGPTFYAGRGPSGFGAQTHLDGASVSRTLRLWPRFAAAGSRA